MAIPYSNLLSFLKQHPLFKQFEEKELVEIIQHLEQILVQPGEDILLQDQLSDRYYVIYSGKVKMRRSQRRMPPAETVLVSGDRFGEETLIFNRPSTVTITAEEESTLLAFSFANFEWLIQTFPEIKEGIQPVTLPPAVQNPQFSWQRPGESVHLAARRHIAILFYDLLKPIGVLGFSLLILFVIGAIPGFTTVSLILGGGLLGAAVLWALWEVLDWSNDLFIITNERVVRIEKIIFQSAARQETPLSAIQSVNIQTSQIGRILGFGNVRVRTFSGTGSMLLTYVDTPKHFQSLIEEQLVRIRTMTESAELQRIRQSIRQSFGLEAGEPISIDAGVLAQEEVLDKGFSLFRTRVVTGDTITYHKHWWLLLQKAFVPGILFSGTFLAMTTFLLRNVSAPAPVYPDTETTFLFGLPLLLFFFSWAAYQIADWNNDVYRLTKDSIIDQEKKPLGREITKSAPVANIQSIQQSRDGLVRILLNFGTVTITVAENPLHFIDVHNPSQVLQDIYYRQERIKFDKQEADAEKERERMSEWLKAYHEILEEEKTDHNSD